MVDSFCPMVEETNDNASILCSLQTRINRLEIVNKDLEHKLFIQNECIERLLRDFSSPKTNTMVCLANEENQQLLPMKEDPAHILFNQNLEKTDEDKLTVDTSIHNLPILNILG